MPPSIEPPLDIPFRAPGVLADLEHTHVKLQVTPEHNPPLAYSIVVPKTWAYSRQFGPVPTGVLETQGLGFFTGSAEAGAPVLAVTVTPVPFEIPIDTWAEMSLATEGWKVSSARWFPGAGGLFYDVVGTRIVNDVPEVRRTSVRVDGSNVLSVNSLCARKHWDAAKELFWTAHDSFRLLRGSGSKRMEPWLATAGRDPDFEVAYPISWSASPVAAPSSGVSAVDIRLVDIKKEILLAYLQIKAERIAEGEAPPTLERLRDEAVAKVTGAGLAFAGLPRPFTEQEDPRSAAVEGWLGGLTARGHLGDADVDVRLGFVYRSGVGASFSLITPLASANALVALRGQRAFEIARATLSLEP